MKKLTAKQLAELQRVAATRDEDIDYSDIPPIRDWAGAVRGRFYRPIKEAVTIRLDADLLHWFRAQGDGYQTRINQALRDYIARQGEEVRALLREAAGGLEGRQSGRTISVQEPRPKYRARKR